MNRHHPYAGNFDHTSVRRGNNSPGPGHERGPRFSDRGGASFRARGGFNRGRGGYGNYDQSMSNHGAYDQGHSQADMGAYNDYEQQQQPAQHPYYQTTYSDPAPANFPPQPMGYNQAYPKYEEGPIGYDDERNRRPIRREREDKVHDSIIEERIQRERPCRTLFIRNIKYETNSDDVRRQFEEFGDIKTFFDLISTRGMVFVTYYDLRAAERARERLQGSEISGRPIDVHYSLPRDDQKGSDREKNQQFQGTLQVTLRSSPSGQPIDDNEVRRKFQQFGDVKSVKPVGDRLDSRYVEFFDTRACNEAFDRLRHQGLQDGVMDIIFAWDANEPSPGGHRDGNKDWDERGNMRGGAGRGRGGRGRGRGRGFDDYDERRGGDYNRRDGGDFRGRGGRYDDESGRGRGGGYTDRYENSRSGYGGPSGYGSGGPPSYAAAPVAPAPASAPPDDRLEQARKVQQLLAALKQPPAPAAPPAPQLPPAPTIQPNVMPMSAAGPSYYPPPPASAPYPGAPPPNPYSSVPPGSNSIQNQGHPPANPALAGLPPNILALIQNAQQQQPAGPSNQIYGMPLHMVNGPPPGALAAGPAAANAAQYQQLMAYLSAQASAKP